MQASYGSNLKCDKRRNESPYRLSSSIFFIHFLKRNYVFIYLFLAVLSLRRCVGFSLAAALGLLTAVASPAVERWL